MEEMKIQSLMPQETQGILDDKLLQSGWIPHSHSTRWPGMGAVHSLRSDNLFSDVTHLDPVNPMDWLETSEQGRLVLPSGERSGARQTAKEDLDHQSPTSRRSYTGPLLSVPARDNEIRTSRPFIYGSDVKNGSAEKKSGTSMRVADVLNDVEAETSAKDTTPLFQAFRDANLTEEGKRQVCKLNMMAI